MKPFSGQIWKLNAFDVGYEISLNQCVHLLERASPRHASRSKRAPVDFGLNPLPIICDLDPISFSIFDKTYCVNRRAVIYDFGVISCALYFETHGSLEFFRDLSVFLSEEMELDRIAQESLNLLVEQMKSAIKEPRISKLDENYFIFQIRPHSNLSVNDWFKKNKLQFSQILRGEKNNLSSMEIEESLAKKIGYGSNDLVILDWATAIVLDVDFEDTLAALDFANVELLEMKLLDSRLDTMVEEAYGIIRSKKIQWAKFFRPYGKSINRLVELMADASSEFEAVNNAIKLTSDQSLARVYRLAAERFHLKAFENDISRKLETLWNIHSVYIDRATNRRLEILEWIIIILIVLTMLPLFQ
jgi:hypothetical protein